MKVKAASREKINTLCCINHLSLERHTVPPATATNTMKKLPKTPPPLWILFLLLLAFPKSMPFSPLVRTTLSRKPPLLQTPIKSPDSSLPSLSLRNATVHDIALLEKWEQAPHIQASIGAYDVNDWNWNYEVPRKVSWRWQLIAVVNEIPIGFVQVIDPLQEETHYWGSCEPNLRAIDIWIGRREYLGKGYGTEMMKQVLRDYCFADPSVEAVLIDPMESNKRVHVFYQRLEFEEEGIRMFGPDVCRIHRLTRDKWEQQAL